MQEVVHRAFTVSSRQGAIYIGQAPVDTTIEMLIHENAHVKLRQIQALDPLYRTPWTSRREFRFRGGRIRGRSLEFSRGCSCFRTWPNSSGAGIVKNPAR